MKQAEDILSTKEFYGDDDSKLYNAEVVLEVISDAQVEVLHEVAKRWHTNKFQRGYDTFKTIDEIILEIKKEIQLP